MRDARSSATRKFEVVKIFTKVGSAKYQTRCPLGAGTVDLVETMLLLDRYNGKNSSRDTVAA